MVWSVPLTAIRSTPVYDSGVGFGLSSCPSGMLVQLAGDPVPLPRPRTGPPTYCGIVDHCKRILSPNQTRGAPRQTAELSFGYTGFSQESVGASVGVPAALFAFASRTPRILPIGPARWFSVSHELVPISRYCPSRLLTPKSYFTFWFYAGWPVRQFVQIGSAGR